MTEISYILKLFLGTEAAGGPFFPSRLPTELFID
jgi:hypothetical protein